MALSLGLILIIAFIINELLSKLKIPPLLGFIILGMGIGPHGANWLDKNLLNISGDLRVIALIIILLRAGLGIKKEQLNQVKKEVVKISSIPGILEALFIAISSIYLLNFSFIQGGILGFIIAAVSPAVIVPKMLAFQDLKLGTKKNIPTIILAGASIDDVIAITLFSTFLSIYSGKNISLWKNLMKIPISIGLGIGLGVFTGYLLTLFFKNYSVRDTKKVILILSLGILFNSFEKFLNTKYHWEISSLLGVMTIGFMILEKLPNLGNRLSLKFNKLWVFAEIILFVLVGAQVNLSVGIKYASVGILILLLGLLGRSLGVYLSLLGTELNFKEKLFIMIAYAPKATVQAAIGAIPLMSGVASGEIILAIAVISILFTAPLGSFSIDFFGKKLLKSIN